MTELTEKHCLPCEGGVAAMSEEKISAMIQKIPGWVVNQDQKAINREFNFKNFAKTMAFVNAVAYVSTVENHHPDIEFGYNYCRILYTTHAIDGLSENDFICAAKVNSLSTL